MTNVELYEHCRTVVEEVRELRTVTDVHAALGKPERILPVGDFFITNPDLTITYCDSVELYHYRDCAIRIGYMGEAIAKVRGMPLAHWVPPV